MSIRKPLPSNRNKQREEYTLINSGLNSYYDSKSKKRYSGVYGLTPKIPLSMADEGSYTLLTELKDVAKQNFKNLILTEPGERIMDLNFGVGLMRYLFEQKGENTQRIIEGRIAQQASRYMPYINLNSVEFDSSEDESNYLTVSIYYSIPSLNIEDFVSITIEE